MKNPVRVFAVLLTALGATAADAQTASRSVQQTRPSLPAQQPQTAPAAAGRASTTALQARPYATVGKQVIPANLFSVEDRAIIIVGGSPVAAGDVKRQLMSELRQLSGPATTVQRSRARVAGIPPGAQVRENGGRINPRKDRVNATGSTAIATALGSGREALTTSPARSYAADKDYCRTHPAEIFRVRGFVTPNGRFTIEGMCFGDQTGAVEAIGQFPGGSMRLVFERWSDGEITAFVPPVSGAPDHTIALTVVRPDTMRSPAVQARFVATREVVPVPARFWSPNADFVQIDVDQGGGNIFSGFKVWGAGSDSRSTPFTLLVNPACWLNGADANARAGRVEAFNGWENGPPHQANVDVVWTPRCTTQTTNYIVATSSQRICSIEFTLSAWASCPVGVAP